MNSSHRFKLFLMMVLQFFIWGAWLPLIFGYLPSLGFSATQPPAGLHAISETLRVLLLAVAFVSFFIAVFQTEASRLRWIAGGLAAWVLAHLLSEPMPGFLKPLFSEQALILNAFPVASIIGMFFSSQWADRKFAAEKFLAFSHFVGGIAILYCGFTKEFWPFFLAMLVHCLLYVPTISITNSIAFANMKDPAKEFGIVRMGGTIGWILAAWPFTFIFVNWDAVNAANPVGLVKWLEVVFSNPLSGDAAKAATKWTFVVAGLASIALAGFSFLLPHTPPKKAAAGAAENLAWLEAVKLLKHPFVLVLWLVTFVDSFVHNCYFNWTGVFLGTPVADGGVGIAAPWITPIMSIGQIAEILTMFVLGATLKKLGWRTTMIVGILGHAARFAVYSFMPQSAGAIILIQVLHGICYAFFFATVYIFVDAYFPKDIRSSAQGLFNLQILGIGALVANSICPWLMQSVYTVNKVVNFKGLFLVPLFAASAAAVALALFFHPPKSTEATAGPGSAPAH